MVRNLFSLCWLARTTAFFCAPLTRFTTSHDVGLSSPAERLPPASGQERRPAEIYSLDILLLSSSLPCSFAPTAHTRSSRETLCIWKGRGSPVSSWFGDSLLSNRWDVEVSSGAPAETPYLKHSYFTPNSVATWYQAMCDFVERCL